MVLPSKVLMRNILDRINGHPREIVIIILLLMSIGTPER